MNVYFRVLKNLACQGRPAAVVLLTLFSSLAWAQDVNTSVPATSTAPTSPTPPASTANASPATTPTPTLNSVPTPTALPSRERTNRLEELFIWKISEELDLSAAEEHEVIAMIKSLDQDKANASTVIDNIQDQMSTTKDPQKMKTLLKDYRKALLNYNNLSVAELDRVQKLLKPERAAKYFVVKANLSQRIRTILGSATRPGEHFRGIGVDATRDAAREGHSPHVGTLPDPKIIEE